MEVELATIDGSLEDFKLCAKCKAINWYENEGCHNCGHDQFDESDKSVSKWAGEEFDFWLGEGYSDPDNVLIDV